MMELSCTQKVKLNNSSKISNNSTLRSKSICEQSSYVQGEVYGEVAEEPDKVEEQETSELKNTETVGFGRVGIFELAVMVWGICVLSGLFGFWVSAAGVACLAGILLVNNVLKFARKQKKAWQTSGLLNAKKKVERSYVEGATRAGDLFLSEQVVLPKKFQERVCKLEERAATLHRAGQEQGSDLLEAEQRTQLKLIFVELLPPVIAGFVRLNATTDQTAGEAAMKGEAEFVEVLEGIEGRLAIFERQQEERELELFRERKKVLEEYLRATEATEGRGGGTVGL